jgi:uncharacterized membrane protein SpoIIM required for sporulation
MLETKFVQQNKQKWFELEKLLAKSNSEPDQLIDHFVQVSEDLSYARTHYPNRSVRVYLNQLTQRIFHVVYKNKKSRWANFQSFWQFELPATLFHSRKELLVAFSIFILSLGIGALSCRQDPSFVRLILGDSYVENTLANIEKGDPMAIYKQSKEVGMFLGITINNVRVALITFVLGVFMGLGTAGFLMYNGIMVGCFQYFFIQKGLFTVSFFTIWLHGTLEISSIVIAGAAGFSLGKGLVFPNTYSRFQSFQVGARKGIRIMLGIIPIFVLAAFIEGFLTRYTEIPNIVRGTLIIASFVFIIYYFVIYPYLIQNHPKFKYFTLHEQPEALDLQYDNKYGIRNFGELLSATIHFVSQNNVRILWTTCLTSGISAALWLGFYYAGNINSFYQYTGWQLINNLFQYFDFEKTGWQSYLVVSMCFAIIQTIVFIAYQKGNLLKPFEKTIYIKLAVYNLLNSCIVLALMFKPNGLTIFLFIVLVPFLLLWNATMMIRNTNPVNSIGQSINLLSESWSMYLGQTGIMIFMVLVINMFGTSPILLLYTKMLSWNISESYKVLDLISNFLMVFTTLFILFFSLAFVFANSLFLYENLNEINQGAILKKRIEEFAQTKNYAH